MENYGSNGIVACDGWLHMPGNNWITARRVCLNESMPRCHLMYFTQRRIIT
ncbi:unnamed protein product [Larinioides sclopetarius]|uniref:Uncharacterized protein n=1 Tax=Larinioides sclopetarius TaxID=280406 RepID=A0AAV2B3F8_9ARAC